MSKKAYGLLLIVLTLPLLGAGCGGPPANAPEEKKEPKAGPSAQLRQFLKKGQAQAAAVIKRGQDNFKDLTSEQKQAIDEWLERNKLNEYGDAPDAVYSGGTPLFNEQTGQTIDRFEYLFKKFPQLKEIIKNIGEEQAK